MYCLYIQVVLLVMLLSAQDLFTCLAHIIYIHCLYIQVLGSLVLLLSAQDLFTCLAHIIYICIAYIFRRCFWSCFCRRRTYLHVLHILYIYIHCLYIQVKLLVLLLSAQDLFTCLAHIIYIYTLLVYSGDASGPATVGAGLIYMSCTYIYIHCLYIQVMLLVMLLSAQDLFTCLAHIIYIYCLLLVLLLSAQDLFTCLANLPHLYQ